MDERKVPEKGAGTAALLWQEPTEDVLRGLEEEARGSRDGEVYQVLARGPGLRLGIAMSVAEGGVLAFAVVLLDASDPHPASPRTGGDAAGRIGATLARRGYIRARLDNGWVALERSLSRDEIAGEWRFLRGLVEPRGSPAKLMER